MSSRDAARREGLGKSRGGSTKIHTIGDGRGRNLTSHLTPGQDPDTRQLVRLLDDVAVARPGGIGRPRKRHRPPGCPGLNVVQTVSAGYDHVLPYLRPGLALANGRGVHDAATAELAVALALAVRRRLPDFVPGGGRGPLGLRLADWAG